MKPLKGIFLDVRPEDQPEGTYPFGKNGVQFDLKGTVVNEEGFKRISQIIPQGYQINGILETDVNKVIVFYTNNVNSCVMLYNLDINFYDYNFTDAALSYKLGFQIDNYITGQVQRNNKGELICVFTDKVTFPKYLNLTTPDTTFEKSWRLFSEFVAPTISKDIVLGGNLAVGSYYVASRYYKTDGTVTSFSQVETAGVVTDENGNEYSDKAIQLIITNQDTSYKYLELAIISKVKGVTKAVLLDKLPVVPGSITAVFTGDGDYTDVSLEEVLTAQVRYEKVGTVAQLNDALYVGNLEKLPDITDMQKYANLIKLEWVSELITGTNPPHEHIIGKKKSFMHEEVYAFYIRYRFFNGSYSIAFTIPGVQLTAADSATSTVGTTGALASGLVYEVEDTITTFSASGFYGVPGAYANKTELYPDTDDFDSSMLGGEDLRNQPVRHHKMPSLRWCKEHLYSADADYGKTKLDLLGIRALNIQIPVQYANLIDGYEILYAKRTTQNMTVYGQDLVLYGSAHTGDPVNSFFNGHNWHVNGATYSVDVDHARFHGFDILNTRPGIKPSHLSHQFRLRSKIQTEYHAWSYPSGGSPSEGRGFSVHLADMTDASATVVTNVLGNFVNALEDPKWVKNHTVNGVYKSTYMATALCAKLLGTPQIMASFPNSTPVTNVPATWPFVEAYLANLCDIKENVYLSFYTQPLISAGESKLLADFSPFWGGDVFISLYTFHTYGIKDEDWDVPEYSGSEVAYPENRQKRIVHRYVCETIGNHASRYEILGNVYSKWFAHNVLTPYNGNFSTVYPADFVNTIDPNQFGYSRGAEGVNDFRISDIFTPYREYLYKFPYRIHRGGKLSRQNTRSWKTFLALDYYEAQKNMGFIVHLEGMDDRLLIHHENALFITQDKAKLESGLLGVTLGSGDLFQFEPQEVQSAKLGYGGTQHDLACVRTPIGYIYPDAKQGEIFLYKGKELTLLNQQIYRFLKEYLNIYGKNCFNGNSITIGWDQKYKRFLLTVNNVKPITEPGQEILQLSLSQIQGVSGTGQLLCASVGTTNFTVNVNDIVFMDGRYLQYMGLNDPLVTGASCPPDPEPCNPAIELLMEIDPDTGDVTFTWAGTGPFIYTLSVQEVDGSWTEIDETPTAGTTATFAAATFSEDTIYKFEVVVDCGDDIHSIPAVILFSVPAIPEEPVDPCAPAGTTVATVIDTWGAWQSNMANAPASLHGMGFRIRTNSGTWTAPIEFGSNPGITLDNVAFGACVDVELMIYNGVTWYHPTDAGFPGWATYFAIESLAVSAIDRVAPPPLSTSSYMSNLFTNPAFQPYQYMRLMVQDYSTQYTGENRAGVPTFGWWRWKLISLGWVGGPTTVVDPLLGTIGPLANFKLWVYEAT